MNNETVREAYDVVVVGITSVVTVVEETLGATLVTGATGKFLLQKLCTKQLLETAWNAL